MVRTCYSRRGITAEVILNNKAPYCGDIRIAYIHIPRCGGQSIQHRLAEYYGHSTCLRVGPFENGGDIQIESDEEMWRNSLRSAKVVYGHYPWPILRRLISKLSLPNFIPLGLVREPLERAISEFCYIREERRHPERQFCLEATIDDYLLNRHYSNIQCHYICHQPAFKEAVQVITKEFAGIAPHEGIDRFSRLLGRGLSQPQEPAPHLNKRPEIQAEPMPAPRSVSRFYEQNSADLQLFWWVKEHWRDHWRFQGSYDDIGSH